MSREFQKRWTERVTFTQRRIFFVISLSQVASQHKLTILLSCRIIDGVCVLEKYIYKKGHFIVPLNSCRELLRRRRFCKILRFLSLWTFVFFISTYYYKVVFQPPPNSTKSAEVGSLRFVSLYFWCRECYVVTYIHSSNSKFNYLYDLIMYICNKWLFNI